MRNILVVEDNPDVADLVTLHLQDAGYGVQTANDGQRGLALALEQRHDLLVLDVMLPSIDGLEICRRVRARDATTPILMLTAKTTELDRVLGLELGSDDYIIKPFSIRELLARVKAHLRRVDAIRNPAADHNERIRAVDLDLDVSKRQARLGARGLDLTAKEFDLLVHFARNPGRVYTRAELLDAVWGYGHRGYEHTVNTHINRLRSKLENDPSRPAYILTVWGVGYKFVDRQSREEGM